MEWIFNLNLIRLSGRLDVLDCGSVGGSRSHGQGFMSFHVTGSKANPSLLPSIVKLRRSGIFGILLEPLRMTFAAAYRADLVPITGGYLDVGRSVRASVARLTQGSRNVWVGVTSRGVTGIRKRWYQKYAPLGMRHISWLYSTTSVDFRYKLEKALIQSFGHKLDNLNAGGGGGAGRPPYAVYVAWA